jgi:tetratricopeptide (TPR) repeat protein
VTVNIDTLNPALQLMLQQALQSFQRGDLAIADSMLRRILKIDPKNLPALHALGLIKASEQSYDEATQFLSKAALINPNDASVQYNLAKSLADGGHHKQSLPHHKKAVALAPNNPSAWLNLGKSSSNLKRHVEALDYFSNVLRLQSNLAEGWFNMGTTLHELKRYEEALFHFDQALNLNSNYHDALANKAFSLHELKRFNEAISNYDKAINLNPDNIPANWNKSLTLLHLGDYANGWPLYEWRWKTELQKNSYRVYLKPLWLGKESLEGKTILVWSEQGLGDTIQFCRYIKIIANLGAKVLFEVQNPLFTSLLNLEGAHELLKLGDELPEFDFHIPLLSIPFALKTTVETIPKSTRYISPLSEKINYWKSKLADKDKIKVGLVWAGGHKSDTSEASNYSDRKNIPLKMFSALENLDCEFHSLQKGANAELQLAQLESESWMGPKIISHTHELNDFSDTAALIENLDLIISVDTAVAHMAGAMGKAVWVLTNYVVDWRWSDGQRESWYPTATVFSQLSDGDWTSVMDRVRHELIKLKA